MQRCPTFDILLSTKQGLTTTNSSYAGDSHFLCSSLRLLFTRRTLLSSKWGQMRLEGYLLKARRELEDPTRTRSRSRWTRLLALRVGDDSFSSSLSQIFDSALTVPNTAPTRRRTNGPCFELVLSAFYADKHESRNLETRTTNEV